MTPVPGRRGRGTSAGWPPHRRGPAPLARGLNSSTFQLKVSTILWAASGAGTYTRPLAGPTLHAYRGISRVVSVSMSGTIAADIELKSGRV